MEEKQDNGIRPPIMKKIDNLGARKISYKKRKACIMKKTMELATLCGIKACTVCFGPDGEVETWPENPCEAKAVIDMYNKYGILGKKGRKVGDFSDNYMGKTVKEAKVEEEIRVNGEKKEDVKKVLLGWKDNWLHGLSAETLKNLVKELDSKLEEVNYRVDLLKNMSGRESSSSSSSAVLGKEIWAPTNDFHSFGRPPPWEIFCNGQKHDAALSTDTNNLTMVNSGMWQPLESISILISASPVCPLLNCYEEYPRYDCGGAYGNNWAKGELELGQTDLNSIKFNGRDESATIFHANSEYSATPIWPSRCNGDPISYDHQSSLVELLLESFP